MLQDDKDAPDAVIEYDSERGPHRTLFEFDHLRPSLALVEAVGAVHKTDPTSIAPIGNTTDMEALDSLLESAGGVCDVRMTLPDHGLDVMIDSDGMVTLGPISSGRDGSELRSE